MTLRRLLPTLCTSLLPIAGACSDCISLASPAVGVTVVDATTGTPAVAGATLYVLQHASGEAIDSVTTTVDGPLYGAWGTTGYFDLVVEKPGYFPWTATGIAVGRTDACVVETVRLTARLRRRGP